ncbi:MAG: pyridoxamine 5'-phosphate oxidase family protein [Hyphomicrobiales bacterium]|nr:pyridoxamine 5'-phosphate oxidase family protein [Hyphomicrobiales bacterium]
MTDADAFSPVATARLLLREARTAALSTLRGRDGHPFGSLVSIACEPDGTPLLLMSGLAAHSRHLAEDPRASLLVVEERAPDPQRGGRLTVVGRVEKVADQDAAARRYLARQPEAALYAGFGDFAYWRLVVEDAHLVAGFGRAMRVRRDQLLLDVAGCGETIAAEADLVARFDADRARVAAWASRLGAPAGDWRVVGVDPEGLDLSMTLNESRMLRRIMLSGLAGNAKEFEAMLVTWEEPLPLQ